MWATFGVYTGAAAVTLGVVAVAMLRRIPVLRSIGSPVEVAALRRAERAEHELEQANKTIHAQDVQIASLEKERSLAAVIDLVQQVSKGVTQTLEQLASLNGTLRDAARAHEHAADSLTEANVALRTSTEAIKFIAGQLVAREPPTV